MKVIMAGRRDWKPSPHAFDRALEAAGLHQKVTEVVVGGAHGVDRAAEAWARFKRLPVKCFTADWESHGPAAGPIRNRAMARYGEVLLLFWDRLTKGSRSMKKEAQAAGLSIYEFDIQGSLLLAEVKLWAEI